MLSSNRQPSQRSQRLLAPPGRQEAAGLLALPGAEKSGEALMRLAEQRTEERPTEQGDGTGEGPLVENTKRQPSGSQQDAQRTKATELQRYGPFPPHSAQFLDC